MIELQRGTHDAPTERHRGRSTGGSARRFIGVHPWIGIVCLGLLLGLAFQGSRGLWSTDEGRYVDGALQMLDSGNFLVPAYSPLEINLAKPPVTYWAIAASIKVFGRNTWAARLPYALAFVLTLLLICGMGSRLLPQRPWLPGLVYALSLAPFLGANVVSTDELLTLCEAIAMYGFVAWAFAPEPRRARAYLWLMWAGWALAFLTKGPPGLLPLLAIIPFVAVRDGWRRVACLFPLVGLITFLVVGLGWYALVVLRVPGTAHYFIHREIYDRVFTAVQNRNPGPWGWLRVYVPVLALGTLPWWPRLLPAIAAAWCARKLARHPNPQGDDRSSLLLWLWFCIPFAVFCFAQSRLPAYLLPLFVPLALLLARALTHKIDLRAAGQRVALIAWVALLLAFKGWSAYAVHLPHRDNRAIARALAAKTETDSYAALVFVQASSSGYAIQERTPWGIRLYLDKPVYAVAWGVPDSPSTLCQAVRQSRSSLLVIAPDLAPSRDRIADAIAACTQSPPHAVGTWRKHPLLLTRL